MAPRYRLFMQTAAPTAPSDGSTPAQLAEYARREALTFGAYRPDAATTGLLTAEPLTVVEGDLVAVSGQLIQNREIRGRILISNANDVRVRNCWIRETTVEPTTNRGMIHVQGGSTGLIVEDCLIDPQLPSQWRDGIRTRNYTAKRCRIRRVTDGFGVFPATSGQPTGVQILGCWVEDLARFLPSSEHADGTHNDCIEVQGGSGTVIRGNRFDGYLAVDAGNTGGLNRQTPQFTTINACVQFSDNVGLISGCVVEDNWCAGAEIGINGGGLTAASSLGSIARNRFDHGQTATTPGGDTTYTINIHSSQTVSITGNVYDDTGAAVAVRRPS